MRKILANYKYIVLTALFVAPLSMQLFGPLMQTSYAAALASRVIYDDSGQFTECTPQLVLKAGDTTSQGNGMYGGLASAMSSSGDKAIANDMDSISEIIQNREKLLYVHFVPVNKSSKNQTICNYGNMFSRPSNPKYFIGYNENTKSLITGIYVDVAKKELVVQGRVPIPTVSYAIVNDPDSGDVLSSPLLLGADNGSMGYCSQFSSSQADAYIDCMQARVVDFSTMTYRGETYKLDAWEGDNMRYFLTSTPYENRKFFLTQENSCKPELRFGTGNSDDYKGKQFDINVDNDTTGEFKNALDTIKDLPASATIGYKDYTLTCVVSHVEVGVSDFTNLRVMFQVFPKEKKISFITNNPSGHEKKFITGEFVQDATNPLLYTAPARTEACSSGNALPQITLNSAPSEAEGAAPVAGSWSFQTDSKGCGSDTIIKTNILVKQTSSTSTDTTETVGQNAGLIAPPTDSTGAEVPISCTTTWKETVSWILCPVIGMAEKLVDSVEGVVSNFLYVDISKFNSNAEGTSSGEGLYKAWNALRQLSTVIIVIVALIMIFSEAMGQGVMSNYSVKKLLPRLVFAGIAIQLSWVFCKELINISNVFGDGIGNLLLAPFGGKDAMDLLVLVDPGGLSGGAGAGFSFALIIGGLVAFGAVGTIAVGLLIALIIAYVTLILRYMVIVLCVMAAPIAISLSVLPGTQKLSKLWWGSLTKALMMFPVIMAMFAAGKIVAFGLMQAADNGDGTQDGWFVLGAIVGYFLPYAFLPTALKAGGTALNKVSGMFTDKNKGLFDRARKAGSDFKTKRQGMIANKYVPGGGMIRNAAARIGSGSTFSKRGAMQKGGQYYNADLKKAQEEMLAIQRNPDKPKRALALKAMAERGNPRVAQAAMEQLLKTGEIETLRKVMTEGKNKTAISTFMVASRPEIKAKAVDLVNLDKNSDEIQKELAKMSTAEILQQDSTVFTEHAKTVGVALESRAKASMADKEQWDNLGTEAKARLLHLAGAPVPIDGTGLDHTQLDALRPSHLPVIPSDIRLKRNITYLSTRQGYKIYSYQYKWSNTYYVGVMAQDILETLPEAVNTDILGYYHVDYSQLGMKLETLYEWQKHNKFATPIAVQARRAK